MLFVNTTGHADIILRGDHKQLCSYDMMYYTRQHIDALLLVDSDSCS